MNADGFLFWLGEQLEEIYRTPTDDARSQACKTLAEDSIRLLGTFPSQDRECILRALDKDQIGTFRIPFDKPEFDWIEGVIATLQGYLE